MIKQKPDKMLHRDFALRMTQATDGNSHVPLPNFGRLRWFVEQLETRQIKSTPETVRKWFAGQALPRPKAMAALADILKVDQAWLALGKSPELDERQQRLRNAEANGAVNVVTGLVQLCGGHVAFPTATDDRALREKIDLYAIIRGAQYAFHVTLARDDRFFVPVEALETLVLGVRRIGDLAVEIYELESEILGAGKRRGGFVELESSVGKRITTFAERL